MPGQRQHKEKWDSGRSERPSGSGTGIPALQLSLFHDGVPGRLLVVPGIWLYTIQLFLGWGRRLLPIYIDGLSSWLWLPHTATILKPQTERYLKSRESHGGGKGKPHTSKPSRPVTEEKLVPFSHHGPQTPGECWPLTVALQENPRKTGLS